MVTQDYPGDIECIVVHDQEQPDDDLALLGAPHRAIRVTTNTAHSPGPRQRAQHRPRSGGRRADRDLRR